MPPKNPFDEFNRALREEPDNNQTVAEAARGLKEFIASNPMLQELNRKLASNRLPPIPQGLRASGSDSRSDLGTCVQPEPAAPNTARRNEPNANVAEAQTAPLPNEPKNTDPPTDPPKSGDGNGADLGAAFQFRVMDHLRHPDSSTHLPNEPKLPKIETGDCNLYVRNITKSSLISRFSTRRPGCAGSSASVVPRRVALSLCFSIPSCKLKVRGSSRNGTFMRALLSVPILRTITTERV